jgi:uncharacterized circularly permuted ATP-grasp superfamily protein/uncharacterized alpha-E superfamily protein
MAEPRDEMVDGSGGLRLPWRQVHANLTGLGREVLADRARQLDRIFAEEGLTGLLPGAAPMGWRCDPIPLPLGATEFASLAAGLAQRAQLLEAVLADVYGPQHLLAKGALPPALVYANPGFLRPFRSIGAHGLPASRPPRLQLYAAELLRDPNGQWRVIADRTADAAGTAYALENRRSLARVVPELFRGQQIRRLRPFFENWQDALQRLAPAGGGNPGLALLTAGSGDKLWFEHVVLARELSCALVEGGDLTVRDGTLFLKTLRGLSRVDVLLRRQDGRTLDPLELESGPTRGAGAGIPGLLDAMREGSVRVVNDAGAGFVEAPALAAFLPDLARRLLGEELRLPGIAARWLGDGAAREAVLADLTHWRIRSAFDGSESPLLPAQMPPEERAALAARIAAHGEAFVALPMLTPSVAPWQSPEGKVPRPVVLRLFLLFDGTHWQAMPGGLARALSEQDALTGRLPLHALSKDVWVAAEDEADIHGPSQITVPALAIRRTAGDLPSRVGDNFFWLGRYLERLEGTARLVRLTIAWLERPTPTPREMAELQSLVSCLAAAGLVEEQAVHGLAGEALARALRQLARDGGRLAGLLAELTRLTELLRDRLTGEVYAAISQHLRALSQGLRKAADAAKGLEPLAQAMAAVLGFSATVAGLAAENMVRGGGRLFLDLGRRMERARAIATELGCVLDQPGASHLPSRLEPGLRLALELRDSVITYRSRYLTVLQPAPVLDLVLADEGNPRGLAFQLVAVRDMLAELGGRTDAALAQSAATLLEEVRAMVQGVLDAPQQAAAALALPPRLKALAESVAQLSDRIGRRYFALLPAVRSVGLEGETRRLRGIA